MRDAIDDLLDRMTLDEKVALLAGSDAWHTTPIPRLGIPALKVTDGPNGARGAGNFVGGLREALAYYDDAAKQWVAEAGTFEVLVGASSQDIRAAATLTLTATLAFSDTPAGVAPTAMGSRTT